MIFHWISIKFILNVSEYIYSWSVNSPENVEIEIPNPKETFFWPHPIIITMKVFLTLWMHALIPSFLYIT